MITMKRGNIPILHVEEQWNLNEIAAIVPSPGWGLSSLKKHVHGKNRAAAFCIRPLIFSLVDASRIRIS